jgi:predicted small lipoprotein YifL
MFKRLLLLVALVASIAACGGSSGSSTPAGGSVAPVESVPADSLAPSTAP